MALTLNDLGMISERVVDGAPISGVGALKNTAASVWIGSGLAKISAAYGAALTEQYTGRSSQMMTALDYCSKPLLRSLPILVSLKGRHEDAVSVANSIVSRCAKTPFLITGEPEGPAALALKSGRAAASIVTAGFPERDRRFVNCGSIFMLSALTYQLVRQAFGVEVIGRVSERDLAQSFSRAADGGHAIAERITSIEDWHNKQLIVLGQGLGSELTLPWQSVFSEAGIAAPIVHDIKDYTHGDHLAAVRTNNVIFLVIQHRGIEEICQIFASRFETRFQVIVAPLESQGPTRFWESLFYCCNTADALTERLGYGGQRVPKDPVVHGWRGWGNLS